MGMSSSRQPIRDDEERIARLAAHHLVSDLIDVDRLVHRLAHAQILEWILIAAYQLITHVETEHDGAKIGPLQHLDIGRRLKPRDVLDGGAVGEVDLARK